jgi:hypothetical protein
LEATFPALIKKKEKQIKWQLEVVFSLTCAKDNILAR